LTSSEPLTFEALRKEVAYLQHKQKVPARELEEAVLKVCRNQFLTLDEIASLTNKKKSHLRKNILKPLVDQGKVERRFPDAPTHKEQAYRTKF